MKLKHMAILVIFMALGVPALFEAQDADDQQSPEQVAYICLVEGDVGYQRGDDSQAQWSAAAINTPLMAGDSVYANERGRAEIQLSDGNFLRVGMQGYISLLRSDDRMVQFKVASGQLRSGSREWIVTTRSTLRTLPSPCRSPANIELT